MKPVERTLFYLKLKAENKVATAVHKATQGFGLHKHKFIIVICWRQTQEHNTEEHKYRVHNGRHKAMQRNALFSGILWIGLKDTIASSVCSAIVTSVATVPLPQTTLTLAASTMCLYEHLTTKISIITASPSILPPRSLINHDTSINYSLHSSIGGRTHRVLGLKPPPPQYLRSIMGSTISSIIS